MPIIVMIKGNGARYIEYIDIGIVIGIRIGIGIALLIKQASEHQTYIIRYALSYII